MSIVLYLMCINLNLWLQGRLYNKEFHGCDDLKSFTIGGSSVEFATSFVHLGHVISAKMDSEL